MRPWVRRLGSAHGTGNPPGHHVHGGGRLAGGAPRRVGTFAPPPTLRCGRQYSRLPDPAVGENIRCPAWRMCLACILIGDQAEAVFWVSVAGLLTIEPRARRRSTAFQWRPCPVWPRI